MNNMVAKDTPMPHPFDFAINRRAFLGRYAGGFFIYALSILDAYKIARIKWETWRYAQDQEKA